jgi:hypothetical protein
MAGFGMQATAGEGPEIGDCAANADRRALVPISFARPIADHSRHPAGSRAIAPFIAHLLATADGLPQTRRRRRAEPAQAVSAYADCMQVRPMIGRAVHESR